MKVAIDNVPGLDGTYEFNDPLTNDDYRFIKREAGVRAGELHEAMLAGDNDLAVCFAIIAIRRSGREFDPRLLWDAEAGHITIDASDEEPDNNPPVSAPASDSSGSGQNGSSSPSSRSSGEANQETSTLAATGSLG